MIIIIILGLAPWKNLEMFWSEGNTRNKSRMQQLEKCERVSQNVHLCICPKMLIPKCLEI